MSAPTDVRTRLARAALRSRALLPTGTPRALHEVTLLPHQVAAVAWLLARITRYGGALLADPPGLGKTYVALGVAASRGERPLIIAPAVLRLRWLQASVETGVALDFVSTERLSAPAALAIPAHALVIIDEAHHLRTQTTRRYQRTVALCESAAVLLISATPIHNRQRDLHHLTSLFHLPATPRSATYLRRHLTLRRTLPQIVAMDPAALQAYAVPAVEPLRTLRVRGANDDLLDSIEALPSIHNEDAESHALLRLGLLHAYRSSDAALLRRIRRRIAVTLAIEQAVEANVRPTRELRRAWHSDSTAIQLAMPLLLAAAVAGGLDTRLASSARLQREALATLAQRLDGRSDRARANVLRRLARWCSAPVVAFTQFDATAHALYHALRQQPGIALLNGSSARIASGTVSRNDVLHRLLSTGQRARHTSVRLLITTDVLSEGLSLAGVATVVHLDLPWTAARIDQRVGRAARIGAPVTSVRPVSLPAPVPDAAHARLRALLAQKRRAMQPIETETAASDVLPALRALLVHERPGVSHERWATIRSPRCSTRVILAIVDVRGRRMLAAVEGDQLRAPTAADWDLLSGGVATARRAGAVRRLRKLLLAHLADSEMSLVQPQRRDARRQSRRITDETLLYTSPAERSRLAAEVTEVRRRASTAERPSAVARLQGDSAGTDRRSLAITAFDAHAARMRTAPHTACMDASGRDSPTAAASVRVFAGVELLPIDV